MCRGKKTTVFWVGVHVVAWASVILFSILWYFNYSFGGLLYVQNLLVPPIVGGVVFILIGICMIIFGMEREDEAPNERVPVS